MFPPLDAALQTLAAWLALAPTSVSLLAVAALALLVWGAWHKRSRGGVCALLGAAEAVALAVETLLVRASAQAVYDALTADPFAGLSPHGPPEAIAFYERRLLALVQTAQLQVAVVLCVGAVFLFGVVIVGVRLWLRAQGPALARIWRGWSRGWRTVAALALLLACAGSAGGAFAAYQARQPKPPAPCSAAITAADDAQLQAGGVSLIPSADTVPIDAQMALSTAQTGLSASLPTQSACVITQLRFVEASSVPEVPRFAIIWVVGFHSPATAAEVTALGPGAVWAFVDAQSGSLTGCLRTWDGGAVGEPC